MVITSEVEPAEASPRQSTVPVPDRPDGGVSFGVRLLPWVTAGVLYLGLSVVLWWGAWSTHPTATTTCGCGDASLYFWFLEWPAYALGHGHSVLWSTAAFHPTGWNLLSNTGVLAIGVVLAPVTWLFGPVASLNVASTLVPVLSALSMCWLLRRWVAWSPAAFVGGLLYGFSPFIVSGLVAGWLTTLLVVPPLMVGCLDELCVRRRRRPVPLGIALGLLVVLQFFISTELLAITVIGLGAGFLLFVGYHLVVHPAEVRRSAGRVATGLGVGAGLSAVLLAYPVWFTFAGPAHLSGPVWPSLQLGYEGATLRHLVVPSNLPASFLQFTHRTGGYQGTTPSAQYVGIGALAVIVVGLVVWRSDRRLWLIGVTGAMAVVLSLGALPNVWLPWSAVAHLPELENIIPSRFMTVTYLAVALLVGLITDHAYVAVRDRRGQPSISTAPPARSRRRRSRDLVAWMVGLAVAAVAVVPIAWYLGGSVPVTTEPVVVPTWFSQVAPHLPGRQVLLVYPFSNQVIQSAMTWQALDRMHFDMVDGDGPGTAPSRGGAERRGLAVIGASSFSFTGQHLAPGDVAVARQALDHWGVTMVVVPDQADLPDYDMVTSVPYAVALVTAAVGSPPVRQHGAWVWTGVDHAGPAVDPAPAAFDACVATGAAEGTPVPGRSTQTVPPSAVSAVAGCVLHAPVAT